VPSGNTRSSAVGICVCVPTTADTRPSRYQPIATFSLVASACSQTITVLQRRHRPTGTGCVFGVVGGAQQVRGFVNKFEGLGFIPDVVAGSHYVDTTIPKLVGKILGNAKTTSRILDVNDNDVDTVACAKVVEIIKENPTPRFGNDVANKEYVHVWIVRRRLTGFNRL